MTSMVLTSEEEALIGAVRSLPVEEVARLTHWAKQIGALSKGGPVEWSDSWSDEDIAEIGADSMRHFEENEERGD